MWPKNWGPGQLVRNRHRDGTTTVLRYVLPVVTGSWYHSLVVCTIEYGSEWADYYYCLIISSSPTRRAPGRRRAFTVAPSWCWDADPWPRVMVVPAERAGSHGKTITPRARIGDGPCGHGHGRIHQTHFFFYRHVKIYQSY